MKKTIKIILIIIFFICFLGLFLRPVSSVAVDLPAYTAMTQFRDYIAQPETNAILSQFYTYSYLGLTWHYRDGSTVSYRVNLVVGSMSNSSSDGYDYVTYYPTTGSYYYTSEDNYSVPRSFTGAIRIQYYNTARQLSFLGDSYWFYQPSGYAFYGLVDYCDLTDSYYSNHADGSSLVKHNLYSFPSTFNSGVISTPSPFDTLGDIIDTAIDTASPAPVVTTAPPFQPPATVPPVLPPAETVTAFPAVTDDNDNYYIDYSPYIDGNFYSPPATEDISLSPALSASGAVISEGFGWLTDSGIFSVLLVLMLVSFAIYNLI